MSLSLSEERDTGGGDGGGLVYIPPMDEDQSFLRGQEATVSLQGGFLSSYSSFPALCFLPEHVIVRLELFVSTQLHPATHLLSSLSRSTVQLPLSQLHQLGHLIHCALFRDGGVIGDDFGLPGFLASAVSSLVIGHVAARGGSLLPAPHFLVNAHIRLLEPLTTTTTAAPLEARVSSASAAICRRLLKKVTYKSSGAEVAVRETACPICLEDFAEEEEVQLTPCGHPFHLHCLRRSFERRAECPLCRTAMT